LDQLTLSKNSHKTFKVCCDYKVSDKCRIEYDIQYRDFIKHTSNNNGNLPCIFCSRTMKFSGRNNPNTKYKSLNDNFFEKIDSQEKAYILGWIGSDGTIGKRGFTIAIQNSDEDILIKLKDIICSEIPIVNYINSTGTLMSSFDINSGKISKDLCKLFKINPGKKSDIVRLPQIDKKYFWSFIRGYFDGDGTINDLDKTCKKYLIASIRSTSNFILNDFKKAIDIKSYLTVGHSISWENKFAYSFLEEMYKDAIIWLPRKRNRFEKWKNKHE